MVSSIAIGSKSFIFSPLLELEKPYSLLVVINIRNEVRRHATTGTNNLNFSAEKFKDFTWLHHNMNTSYPKFGRKFIAIVPEDGSINKQISRAIGPYVDDISPDRIAALNGIIEALKNHNLIGVYGSNSSKKADLLEKLCNRARWDNLFDYYVTATVTNMPNIENIQDTIAAKLGLQFNTKNAAKRAHQLLDHIRRRSRILIYLCDLPKGIDLRKIGIPVDHQGCKIVVTSTSQKVVKDMKAHQIFKL